MIAPPAVTAAASLWHCFLIGAANLCALLGNSLISRISHPQHVSAIGAVVIIHQEMWIGSFWGASIMESGSFMEIFASVHGNSIEIWKCSLALGAVTESVKLRSSLKRGHRQQPGGDNWFWFTFSSIHQKLIYFNALSRRTSMFPFPSVMWKISGSKFPQNKERRPFEELGTR